MRLFLCPAGHKALFISEETPIGEIGSRLQVRCGECKRIYIQESFRVIHTTGPDRIVIGQNVFTEARAEDGSWAGQRLMFEEGEVKS